jgi:hypothetical protein
MVWSISSCSAAIWNGRCLVRTARKAAGRRIRDGDRPHLQCESQHHLPFARLHRRTVTTVRFESDRFTAALAVGSDRFHRRATSRPYAGEHAGARARVFGGGNKDTSAPDSSSHTAFATLHTAQQEGAAPA